MQGGIRKSAEIFPLFRSRNGTWQLSNEKPQSIVESALHGYRSSLRFLKLLKVTNYTLFIALNITLYAISLSREKPILIPVLIANTVLVVLHIVVIAFQRKRQAELSQMEKNLMD